MHDLDAYRYIHGSRAKRATNFQEYLDLVIYETNLEIENLMELIEQKKKNRNAIANVKSNNFENEEEKTSAEAYVKKLIVDEFWEMYPKTMGKTSDRMKNLRLEVNNKRDRFLAEFNIHSNVTRGIVEGHHV